MRARNKQGVSLIVLLIGVLFLLVSVDRAESESSHPVIARIWQGRTSHAKADEYENYLKEAGMPKFKSAAGNLGVQILRRPTSDAVEFVVISYWESREAIKKIVGDDIEKAFPLPRDPEFLLEPATSVRHYELVYKQER